jgi:thiol:disulfide interchange protein DsbA
MIHRQRFVTAFAWAALACSVAMLVLARAHAAAPANAATPIEGRDYIRLKSGSSLSTPAGQVEVVEFFSYACPACYAFDPHVRAWKAKLPSNVRFLYLPMDFRPDFVQYARAYYAAESLGIAEKSHTAVFKAIHETRQLPGEGPAQNPATIANFYAQFGVSAADFRKSMESFSVQMKVANAREFAARSQVASTPTLLIDGRYLVRGNSWQEMLRIAGELIRLRTAGTI